MTQFNLRVYALIINEHNQVLLSFEKYPLFNFTKFPGGGLDFGESTLEALSRELKEELGVSAVSFEHFYTTDFFQKSVVDDSQIISIYYLTTIAENLSSLPRKSDTGYVFFEKIDDQLVNKVSLPIDKKVAKLLAEKKDT